MSVMVAPFTGGPFRLQVSRKDSVEEFKKVVAKRLKVLKDRICLLYRDRYVASSRFAHFSLLPGPMLPL